MSEISVLINNYNYGKFLKQAILSVLEQDFPDFELLIVDDGSTDDSRSIISSFTDSRIRGIFKENGGQLSAFNAGVTSARGEIVCFLDADDMYSPGYLAEVARFFKNTPECGCLFAPVEYIGDRRGMADNYSAGRIGCNPFSAAARHVWTGTITSACSMRRCDVLKFLPYSENEKYWVTRADDLLMWGADMVGAVKYALEGPVVKYRIHGNNLFANTKKSSAAELMQRKIETERFCDCIMKKNGLSFSEMLKKECLVGSLSFGSRLGSLLKTGRDRMMSFSEWMKCLLILLGGIASKS